MGQCITHVNTIMGFPSEQELLNAKCRAAQSKLIEGINLLSSMERQMDFEIEIIQQEVRKRNKSGDKSGALAAYKSLMLKQKDRDNKRQMRTTIESQYNTIQTNQFTGELHKVMSECNNALKGIAKTCNIDEIQNTMDDLDDIFSETKEISNIMATPVGDNLEQDAELELEEVNGFETKSALEKQMEKFLETEPPVPSQSSPYVSEPSVIMAPHVPQNNPFSENDKSSDSHVNLSYTTMKPSNSIYYSKNTISGKKIVAHRPNIKPPSMYSNKNNGGTHLTSYRTRHI